MSEIKNLDFSVAMSVYKGDKKEEFEEALNSILNQNVKPKEIVIVLDGPVESGIAESIILAKKTWRKVIDIVTIQFKKNQGLGKALRAAVLKCKFEWIARMDSDDISVPDRFEKQIEYITNHPETDIVGGQISEFINNENECVGIRNVPLKDREIKEYLKCRSPFNHVTVFFKKDAVLRSGNYREWPYNEDYFLWIRMAEAGCIFGNIDKVLVKVRVGKEMYKRRGGFEYFKSEKGIQWYMLKRGIIRRNEFIRNVLIRFLVQRVMPDSLRGLFFKYFARKH